MIEGLLTVMRMDAAAFHAHRVRSAARHPGFRMLLEWRLAAWLHRRGWPLPASLLRQRILRVFGCDLSLKATLGPAVRFPHPLGIVIGDNVVIEGGATVMQHVTLGGNGHIDPSGRSTPWLGRGAFIGPGAVVVGPVHIDAGLRVRANSVVSASADGAVPPRAPSASG